VVSGQQEATAERTDFMNALKHNRKCAFLPAFLFAFILCAVHYPLPTAYAGGPGSAAVQILKTDISPRAMGMGGSFVAVADDIYAINYNPAGLARLYVPEASAMYLAGFKDSELGYYAFGMPMPFLGLAGLEKPAMAASLIVSDAGRFNWRTINEDGSVSSRGLDAQTDKILTLSYGEKIYSGEVNLEGYHAQIEQYLGMSVKYITSNMLQRYSGSALAFDGGWLIREPNLGLTLGAGLANYSGGIKYVSETEKLPSILRLGMAWQRPTVMDQTLLVTLEGDFYTAETQKSLRLGLEYSFEKIFKARIGYKGLKILGFSEDNKGMAWGLGVCYNDMALDFASSLGNEVFNTSQLAFSYKFTGFANKAYKRKVNFKERKLSPKTEKPAYKSKTKKPQPAENENRQDSDFFLIH